MSGRVSSKAAYEKLATFASAMARGATIVMTKTTGSTEKTCSIGKSGDSVDATYFDEFADIEEIIEPTILRDWTAEDAKKHLGYGIRHIKAKEGMFCIGSLHCTGQSYFEKSEYATPVPGTDPAKWDWKPCKVEVPASEPPKADPDPEPSIDFMTKPPDRVRRHNDLCQMLSQLIFWRRQGFLDPAFVDVVTWPLKRLIHNEKTIIQNGKQS